MKLKRDLKGARKAFRKKDISSMIKAHNTHKELHDIDSGKYLKSWVYGGLDGIITTFAVVAGVIGAGLSSVIILILGFANLIADGISMAIGDYLSSKSEGEYYDVEKEREAWEVKHHPKGEEAEMKEIYLKKGLNKKDASDMVKILKKNKKYWIETMMHEELGLLKGRGSPIKKGLATFIAFIIFGIVPLLLFVIGYIFEINIPRAFLWACVLSGISMFTLGSMKSKITGKNWLRAGVEMLLIGGLAASAAYFIGDFLAKIV